MKTQEWSDYVDKSAWGDGAWQSEPDKKQWKDPTTGLPCLIVRGSHGGWCGYVGVSPSHPAHGLSYDGTTKEDAERRMKRFSVAAKLHAKGANISEAMNKAYEGLSERDPVVCDLSHISVHGGLTFADSCHEINEDVWQEHRANLLARRDEAKQYPVGDAARALKNWAAGIDDYPAWEARARATFICHIPGDSKPDDTWWFGFDSAHAGDYSPAFDGQFGLNKLGSPNGWGGTVQYRDQAYAEAECTSLAKQLDQMKRALPSS